MPREWSGKAITIGSATVCMIATAILAANLNNIPIASNTSSITSFLKDFTAFLFPTTLVLWCIALVFTFLGRTKAPRVKREDKGGISPTFWGMIIVLIIALVISVAFQTGDNNTSSTGGTVPPADKTDNSMEESMGTVSPPSFSIFSIVPIVLILGLIFWLSYRRFKVKREGNPDSLLRYPEQVATVNRILTTVNEARDIRSSIIQAYDQMCHLVQGPLSDNATLTPRELEDGLVRDLGWPPNPVHRLTEMFEEARYSDHPLDEEDRTTVLSNLSELKASIGG